VSVSESTTQPGAAPPAPGTPARRLLDSATKLFKAQGIRAVGIDLLLRDAGVAKASLYSSFGSKDGLVEAYLQYLDQTDRNRWADAVAAVTEPGQRILTFFDLAIRGGPTGNFRGCHYANAATEFPEADLRAVREHREWVFGTIRGQLAALGNPQPGAPAAEIQLIYDGALSGAKFDRSVAPIELGRALAADVIDRSRLIDGDRW